jgi:signal peptidase I
MRRILQSRLFGRRGLVIAAACGLGCLFAVGTALARVVEPHRSPTRTMAPTLTVGDRFLVDKRQRPLQRGEVVLFRVPPNLSTGYDLRVKRAVALAGDTVEMRDGTLLVNGQPVSACQVGPQEWEETLDGRRYRVLRHSGGPRSSYGPTTVPPGHFFMLGDNRDENNDSRLYQTIPVQMVIGRAVWIWWSRAPEGGVRWRRLGRLR